MSDYALDGDAGTFTCVTHCAERVKRFWAHMAGYTEREREMKSLCTMI